jgi:hypothetical protein
MLVYNDYRLAEPTTGPLSIQVNAIDVVKQPDSVESTKWIDLNESLSMEVFQVWGIAFIPTKEKTVKDRESDALTYRREYCLDIFLQTGLDDLTGNCQKYGCLH